MKIKIITVLCFICISYTTKAQELLSEVVILDNRDGKEYKALNIKGTIWLAENMKFKTEKSVEIEQNKTEIALDGYYYPYDEADKACPVDFEIPTESDWIEYVEYILNLQNIPKSSTEYSSYSNRKKSGTVMTIKNDTFNFFEDPNPLNLKESGTLQGNNLISDDAMNFWSRMDNSTDTKYHLHITKSEYGNHTHKHNIITKKDKKKRKFVVRCIKREAK